MDLYFSPLACSLATRISLYEAGGEAGFIEVDPKTKRIMTDGSDYTQVYPLGMVPAIRLDDGGLLTENAAILQYVADRFPDANLAPKSGIARTRLHQWLCFIGTELHKGLFAPLFDRKAPEGTAANVLAKAEPRLAYLNGHLTGREFLLDSVQRCRRLSLHGAELEHGDAGEVRPLPGDRGLLRPLEETSERCEGVRRRARALQGRAGAAQAGGVALTFVMPGLVPGIYVFFLKPLITVRLLQRNGRAIDGYRKQLSRSSQGDAIHFGST